MEQQSVSYSAKSFATLTNQCFSLTDLTKSQTQRKKEQAEIQLDELKTLININSQTNKEKIIFSLISKYPHKIKEIIKLIPFNLFAKMYNEMNFLDGYLSAELMTELVTCAEIRFKCNLLNEKNSEDNLIDMSYKCNSQWNFIPELVAKRITKLLELVVLSSGEDETNKSQLEIDINNFYFGTDILNIVCNNQNYTTFVEELYCSDKKIIFPRLTLYAKNKCTSIPIPETKVFKCEEYCLIMYKGVLIHIPCKLYSNKYDVMKNNNIFFDPSSKEILVTPNAFKTIIQSNSIKTLSAMSLINVRDKIFNLKKKISFNKQDKKILFDDLSFLAHTKFCYCCKKHVPKNEVFERYNAMCITCGITNYEHRINLCDLKGKKALVTGVRHTIGFNIVLKLLRCGCCVYGTSRFPSVTIDNFRSQPDFDDFKDRLKILYCNFMSIVSVMNLIEMMKLEHIDFLINNASQTTKPSSVYLQKLSALEQLKESQIMDTLDKDILAISSPHRDDVTPSVNTNYEIVQKDSVSSKELINHSDYTTIKLNKHHNVVEEQRETSWTQRLEDISPTEIIEVNLVNQMVPTLLVSQLKPTMNKPSFVLNVSSREGQFSQKNKTSFHAHTNMCKAGLNMLTFTLAQEHEPNFFIHSIDPGYVSGIDPSIDPDLYPLEGDDGASRVLHPIVEFFNHKPVPSDWLLIKDYHKVEW